MKIEKTKAGTYTTRVCITDETGKKHFKRFTDKSKDRVRNMANDYLNTNKFYTESTALVDAAKRFLDHADAVLSPSTVRSYKSYDRYFKDAHAAFYGTQMDRITSSALQAVIDNMNLAKQKPKTITNKIRFLSSVFTTEGRRLPRYVLPKPIPYEPKVPSEEMMKKVVAAAAGTRYEIPLALAVFGLRRGEVCAVKAEDIDKNNVLHVCRALSMDDDGIFHEKTPKETASDRFIPLPADVADQIRKNGVATTMSPIAWASAFRRLLERAGIPEKDKFRLHDCRHFFVSYCHDVLKLSDAEIIKLSGHKTDSIMKRVYRHAITDNSETVRDNLSGILKSGNISGY